MLTRLEVHGFKNLLGFQVELGPFTCIAGPNGSGKSNIFDAIRLLSLLADYPLMEAVQRLRGANGHGVDPRERFWRDGSAEADEMQFAAEMIVPFEVSDDFGRHTAHDRQYEHHHIDPEAVYARVTSGLSELLGVRALRANRDDQRQLLTLEL